MDAKDILKWNGISRAFGLHRNVIEKNRYPEKYRQFLDDLISAIETVFEKYGLK
jgi:hypothetical protein